MQTIIAGATGAAIGTGIAVAANAFVLPWVERRREAHAISKGASPSERDRQVVVLVYRYLMPPCLVAVFAVFFAFQFGGMA